MHFYASYNKINSYTNGLDSNFHCPLWPIDSKEHKLRNDLFDLPPPSQVLLPPVVGRRYAYIISCIFVRVHFDRYQWKNSDILTIQSLTYTIQRRWFVMTFWQNARIFPVLFRNGGSTRFVCIQSRAHTHWSSIAEKVHNITLSLYSPLTCHWNSFETRFKTVQCTPLRTLQLPDTGKPQCCGSTTYSYCWLLLCCLQWWRIHICYEVYQLSIQCHHKNLSLHPR